MRLQPDRQGRPGPEGIVASQSPFRQLASSGKSRCDF